MPASPMAKKIAKAILDDVTDRRGWRQEWDQFDDGVKREIKQTWHEIIDKCLVNT